MALISLFCRLYTQGSAKKSSTFYSLLSTPLYQKVMENNVDIERTFQGKFVSGLDIVLSESNSAYIYIKYVMENYKAYECKVNFPK